MMPTETMAEMVGMANQLMVGQWLQLQRSDLSEWLNSGESGDNRTKANVDAWSRRGRRPRCVAKSTANMRGREYGQERHDQDAWLRRRPRRAGKSMAGTRGQEYGQDEMRNRDARSKIRPRCTAERMAETRAREYGRDA